MENAPKIEVNGNVNFNVLVAQPQPQPVCVIDTGAEARSLLKNAEWKTNMYFDLWKDEARKNIENAAQIKLLLNEVETLRLENESLKEQIKQIEA